MIESKLFLGLPLASDDLTKIKSSEAFLRIIGAGDDHLKVVKGSTGFFLGKVIPGLVDHESLQNIEANVYSLLILLMDNPRLKEEPLILFPLNE